MDYYIAGFDIRGIDQDSRDAQFGWNRLYL